MMKSGYARRAGVALLLAACSKSAPPAAAPPPPEVRIVTVSTQPIANVIELPGRLQAVRTSEVRARVDGIVQRRLYTEGTDVREGQPLFAIDPRELRAQFSAAQAALARAEATAANAAQDVARYRGLVAQQALSQQEYDAAVARLRTAQADVAQNRAQISAARLNLGYTTVTAPISGRAGRAEVTEGALVSGSGATLLTRIEQLDPIYANFSQSSSELLALRGQVGSGAAKSATLGKVPVRLVLEDGTPYPVPGYLDFLDLSIDEATGTAALRAAIPQPAAHPASGTVRACARRGWHAAQRAASSTARRDAHAAGRNRDGRRREGRRGGASGQARRARGRRVGDRERAQSRRARDRGRIAEGGSRQRGEARRGEPHAARHAACRSSSSDAGCRREYEALRTLP